LGVFSPDVIDTVAATLAELGTRRAFVVHGAGGLDEISLSGETQIAEVRNASVRRFTVAPEDFGLSRAPLEAIRGGTPQENADSFNPCWLANPGLGSTSSWQTPPQHW